MSFRETNEKILKAVNAELFARYESALGEMDKDQGNSRIEPFVSKTGNPVFKFGGVAYHSAYKPLEESGVILSMVPEEAGEVWVFGLGYGYHLNGLLDKGKKTVVVEPSMEIFASAMANADLKHLIEKCEIFVGDDYVEKIYARDLSRTVFFPYRPYMRHFEKEFKKLESSFAVRSYLSEKRLKVMVVSPIYGGSEPTFRYVCRALERIGVEVIPFDATFFAPSFMKLPEITRNEVHLSQIRQLFTNMLSESIAAFTDENKPDLVLAMAQAPLETSVVSRIRGMKIPVAFWFVEDFRTLKYWERVAPSYDYFFTIQKGEFFEKLAKLGANNVAYLPQAASPDVHRPFAVAEDEKGKYCSDLSFMGAGYKNRQEFFKGLMDYDFKIWGTEWNLGDSVGSLVQNRNQRMKPEEYVKIFNATKINLNLHSSTQLFGIDQVGDFVNPRVFEIAACKAFQLVDARGELSPLMEPGKEIETYRSLSELREKIDYYLAHDAEREKVAESGYRRVLADHTFERRMEEMLQFIIAKEGDSLGERWNRKSDSPNIVKNIIAEAEGNSELVKFLENFDPEKPLSLGEVMDKIGEGEGSLSRVESIFQMLNQVLVQK
ncbi:MAG: glycosyltransferase [Nitrospinota bacterium]|nr:glycosyltransferase [Nitrospinota bacterium]